MSHFFFVDDNIPRVLCMYVGLGLWNAKIMFQHGQLHEHSTSLALIMGMLKWILYVEKYPTHVRDESVLNPKTAFGRFPLQIGLLQLRP